MRELKSVKRDNRERSSSFWKHNDCVFSRNSFLMLIILVKSIFLHSKITEIFQITGADRIRRRTDRGVYFVPGEKLQKLRKARSRILALRAREILRRGGRGTRSSEAAA